MSWRIRFLWSDRPIAGVLLAAGLVLAAGRCSLAPEVPLVLTNRVVLAELFTWQRCSYCPYAARALDSLAQEFGDSVLVIAHHRRVAGDTLSPEYVEQRRGLYYEVGGEPATVFDGGTPVRTPGPEYNYQTFRNYILAARSVTPKVQLSIEAVVDSLGGTVTVQVSGVDSTPTDTLRMFLVLVEDSVRATLSGATDSVFNRVMRQMLPGPEGRPFLLSRQDTVEFSESFGLAPGWNPDRLGAVAFVQQPGSNRVLQACGLRRLVENNGGRR